MSIDQIKTICTVGAGNMGHQIAILAAMNGYESHCIDVSEDQLQVAKNFLEKYLPERVAKGKLTETEARQTRERIHFYTDLMAGAENADFVIEAATEKLELKRQLFRELDQICPAHSILTTNSSFIVSSKIADVTNRPEKICNMHFFNPTLVMRVVEVVQGPHTSEDTVNLTMDLCRKIGKTPVLIHKEIYGFIVNRILAALNKEAFWLASEGIASPEDIDIAVEGALNHPMGPFRLVDLTGIDLNYIISEERFVETGDPADGPSPVITQKYHAGDYGRKTGKGFYIYK